MKTPAPGQARVLEAWAAATDFYGLAPTLRDMGVQLGMHHHAVWCHVQALVKKGYMHPRPTAQRNYTLTPKGRQWLDRDMVAVGLLGRSRPATRERTT